VRGKLQNLFSVSGTLRNSDWDPTVELHLSNHGTLFERLLRTSNKARCIGRCTCANRPRTLTYMPITSDTQLAYYYGAV
jgi:hypothetical protein